MSYNQRNDEIHDNIERITDTKNCARSISVGRLPLGADE